VCGIVLLVGPVGLMAPAGASDDAPKSTVQTIVDSVGGVLDLLSGSAVDDPRADILDARVEYSPNWIKFGVRVSRYTNPVKDPNWESVDSSIDWTLETNGDGRPDWLVEFGINDGELYGSVFPFDAPADADSTCEATSVSYDPSGLYTLVLGPECIGRPASFAWRVDTSYDTNVRDANAPAVGDGVPERGFADRVYLPATAPIQPLNAAPDASTTTTQPPATPSTVLVPAPAVLPSPARPGAAPSPIRAVPAPRPSTARPPVTRPAPVAPAASPAPTPAVASGANGPGLARTGAASRELALFAGLLLTVGGLLQFMAPRRQPVRGRIPQLES
jgi:hypothetical protein